MEYFMRRNRESYDELMRKITTALVVKTGSGEQIAQHYARAVMELLQEEKAANGSFYVPSPPQQIDVLQVRAALERGESPKKVCSDNAMSRRTLDRLFPGGLPCKGQKAA